MISGRHADTEYSWRESPPFSIQFTSSGDTVIYSLIHHPDNLGSKQPLVSDELIKYAFSSADRSPGLLWPSRQCSLWYYDQQQFLRDRRWLVEPAEIHRQSKQLRHQVDQLLWIRVAVPIDWLSYRIWSRHGDCYCDSKWWVLEFPLGLLGPC